VYVPNKTIYVSDSDLPIYQRAQELTGDNLSAAIANALRRYVDVEEGREQGFDEIVVRVGPKPGRKVRFMGVLLGEWSSSGWSKYETIRVYRSQKGKYVVYVDRTPEWHATDAEGKPAGWRGALGIGKISYSVDPGGSTLEIIDSLDDLRDKVPPELYEIVAAAEKSPAVEDLDI
jgi:EXLDI family protein